MQRTLLGGKIHRAKVTEADLNYIGSITIDKTLIDAAEILPYERVQVVDIDNGARLETYVMVGEAGSGVIKMNGAAARLIHVGDRVIIMSYVILDDKEAQQWKPKIVILNENENTIAEIR